EDAVRLSVANVFHELPGLGEHGHLSMSLADIHQATATLVHCHSARVREGLVANGANQLAMRTEHWTTSTSPKPSLGELWLPPLPNGNAVIRSILGRS